MSADDRLWPENCNRAEDGSKPTIEPNKQEAIGIAELWSLRSSCAAECGQQLPPSDGDCHTPLPREVRKGNDTTPRACSLHVQGGKIEPKTTSTNGWLRAERDGGLTPRLGNSLASRIDLAPNNCLRSRSRRSRRGGLRGCLRPAAKRATASETDHAASLKKIVWISRRRSRSIHSRRVRITPRFGRVGRCKRPSPSRTACLPCASRPGRLPRCPIHGASKNQYL